RFSKSSFNAWRATGLKSPSHSNPLISPSARDTFLTVACSSSIGVPSSCLCSSHNSGGSTPFVFSQSKNDLGLTLNQLPIVASRPNLKAIFFPSPLSPPKFTHRVIHHQWIEPEEKSMKKKITVLTLCAMLFALCGPVEAQQSKKIARLGYLSDSSPARE